MKSADEDAIRIEEGEKGLWNVSCLRNLCAKMHHLCTCASILSADDDSIYSAQCIATGQCIIVIIINYYC